MVEQLIDQALLMYGFALFFIFFVIIVLIIRYSNKELVRNLTNVYEKIKNTEKDMRQLAEIEMRGKNELKAELRKLREEIDQLRAHHLNSESLKQKARTR